MDEMKIEKIKGGIFDDFDIATETIEDIVNGRITVTQNGQTDKKKQKKGLELKTKIAEFLDIIKSERAVEEFREQVYLKFASKEINKLCDQILAQTRKKKPEQKIQIEKVLKKNNFASSKFIAEKEHTPSSFVAVRLLAANPSNLNLYDNSMSGQQDFNTLDTKERKIIGGYSIKKSLIDSELLEKLVKKERSFKISLDKAEKRIGKSYQSENIIKIVEQFESSKRLALRLASSPDINAIEKEKIQTMIESISAELESVTFLDEKEQRLQNGLNGLINRSATLKKGNKNIMSDLRAATEKDLEQTKTKKAELVGKFSDSHDDMKKDIRRKYVLISNDQRLADLKEQAHQLVGVMGKMDKAEYKDKEAELDWKIEGIYARNPELFDRDEHLKEQSKKTDEYISSIKPAEKDNPTISKPSYDPTVKTTILSAYMREKIMQTQLGKLPFSEYIKTVYPDQEVIIEEARLEEQTEGKTK